MKDKLLSIHRSSLRPSSFSCAERSHSGLVHRSRKPEWSQGHRGFESHPLRYLFSITYGAGAGAFPRPFLCPPEGLDGVFNDDDADGIISILESVKQNAAA